MKMIVAIILLCGIAVLTGCSKSHDHSTAPALQSSVFSCPMHPQVRQAMPGRCPICGMELVAVSAEDTGAPGQLRVSNHAAALMDVKTWPVERRAVSVERRLLAKLAFDETRLFDIVTRTEGQIEKLFINFIGGPVGKGEPLAEFFSPDVFAATQELLLTRSDAARTKLRLLGVSDEQIEDVLRTGQPRKTFTLTAPAAGILRELDGRQGVWRMKGDRLGQLADVSSLWALLDAYESDIAQIRLGQQVTLDVAALPGREFTGAVMFVAPELDEKTRTVKVRLNVPNPDGVLRPGMFARATLRVPVGDEPQLVIPASAPLLTGKRALVYVKVPGTDRPTFEGREVTLGSRAGEYYVVASGLTEGELVVTEGAFKIDSELQLRGQPSMMTAPSETKTIQVPVAFSEAVAEFVKAYLRVTASLVKDELPAMKELEAALEKLDEFKIAEWQPVSRGLHGALRAMAAAKDIEAVRQQLQPLTTQTETAVTQFGAGKAGVLYRAYCPMAFDDKGAYWLQADRPILNPYFGASMLRCGEIKGEVGARPEGRGARGGAHQH